MIVVYKRYVGNKGRIESMWISLSGKLFITSNKNKNEFECPSSCEYNWLPDCLMELKDFNDELMSSWNYFCFKTKKAGIPSLFICSMIKSKFYKQPLSKPPKP